MKRISLEVADRRILVTAKVECKNLRIPIRTVQFIIDTGSYNSYISPKEADELKIPLKEDSQRVSPILADQNMKK